MAKIDKTMCTASRLFAATALTGTLAACDTGINRAADVLFYPLGPADAKEAALNSPRPAEPGNPVYIGGTRSENDALYQQTYGAPLAGSGQDISVQPTFSESVYQDRTVRGAPLVDIPGGPSIDAGTVQPFLQSVPAPAQQFQPLPPASLSLGVPDLGASFIPAPQYQTDPATLSVSSASGQNFTPHTLVTRGQALVTRGQAIDTQIIGGSPLNVAAIPFLTGNTAQLISVPVDSTETAFTVSSNLLPAAVFADASASASFLPVETVPLDLPQSQPVAYGSTASHRYSADGRSFSVPDFSKYTVQSAIDVIAAEPLASLLIRSEPLEVVSVYAPVDFSDVGEPVTVEQSKPEPVEVASLDWSYSPVPRERPYRIDPAPTRVAVQKSAPDAVIKNELAFLSPMPKARPQRFTTPLPESRPVQHAALSNTVKTDAGTGVLAPAKAKLTAAAIVDEGYTEVKDLPEDAAPEVLTASLKPVSLKAAGADTPEPSANKSGRSDTKVAAVLPKAIPSEKTSPAQETFREKPVRVEIADDVGDLKELSGTSWRLSKLNGKKVPASAELHFDGISGYAGGPGICSNYGGEFTETLQGDFEMGNVLAAQVECEHIALEKSYLSALETASGYRVAPGLAELVLLGPDGEKVASFVAF